MGCISDQNSVKKIDPLKEEYSRETVINGKYANHDIGFSLELGSEWKTVIHYNEFPETFAYFADKIKEQGGELLMVGAEGAKGMYMLRIIVEKVDIPLDEYFYLLQDINKDDIVTSEHIETNINNVPMIKWKYTANKGQNEFVYLDYLLKKDKFNIRVSFWTFNALYEKLEEKTGIIMSSIVVQTSQKTVASGR